MIDKIMVPLYIYITFLYQFFHCWIPRLVPSLAIGSINTYTVKTNVQTPL